MEARCFECGTTLVHSDTYMAEDVLTVEGYEGDTVLDNCMGGGTTVGELEG